MEPHFQPMVAHGAYYMNDPSSMVPDSYDPRLHRIQTMSSDTLNSFSDMDDPSRSSTSTQGGAKSKRRQVHGPDHVKHRRTRSGCYTCRQRRVKCDENHPVCERCRKGKRECIYPEPNSSSKRDSSKSKPFMQDSGSNSSGEEYDMDESERLASIPDEDDGFDSLEHKDHSEPSSATSVTSSHALRSPIDYKEKSPVSAVDSSCAKPTKKPPTNRTGSRQSLTANHFSSSKWTHLPKDVRFYMKYHRDELTHHHYALKYDVAAFLKTTFLEIALGYEPLLYAITAFAAYFHTLALPDGKVQYFLGYYDKSVSLLRQSLVKSPRHTVATLLTILQLATFEEYLGDWVNLRGHQRAAFEIITELFTPQTIMKSETHRKIIHWYIRFDIVSGLMSGNETVLSRDWHFTSTDFYIRQARDRPLDMSSQFEARFAKIRLLATDIAHFFSKGAKGLFSDEEFGSNLNNLKSQLATMEHDLETAYADMRTYVTDFPDAPEPSPEDILDSTDPHFVLAGEMFTWNFILVDFWAIDLLFKSQVAQIDFNVSPEELGAIAFKICKMFEALQWAAKTDKDAVTLGTLASMGIAAICLPKDERHTLWCRKAYARIESCGYIYPAVLRKRMSEFWGVDCSTWWLPTDEGYPPILRAIREFIAYRTRVPHDTATEDLRDMKGLFQAMSLDESEIKDTRSTGTGSDLIDPLEHHEFLAYDSSPDMGWS